MDFERPSLPALRAWYDRLRERPAYRQHIVSCPVT
jgi:glutathione S-transferase